MPSAGIPASSRDAGAIRKRRAHKKSRGGCANCKLRGVKCDETKPSCKRCESYNVICTYGSKFSPDNLSIPTAASFVVNLEAGGKSSAPSPLIRNQAQAVPRSPAAPLPICGSAQMSEVYQLVPADIPLLEKFQKRTVWTIGTRATHYVYAERILPLAFSNPLLMHVVLAITEIHDLALLPLFPSSTSSTSSPNRSSNTTTHVDLHLNSCTYPQPQPHSESPSLIFHWYHAISLLQRKLTRLILPEERDVLWVSANLVSIAYFAHVEARAAEAWPLCPSDNTSALSLPAIAEPSPFSHLSPSSSLSASTVPYSSSLAWLKLCDGQRILARLTNPSRRGGLFELPAREMMCAIARVMRLVKGDERDREALPLLPEGFYELFELSSCFTKPSSTPDSRSVAESPSASDNHDNIENEKAKDHEHDFDCAYECVYPCAANVIKKDNKSSNEATHTHDNKPKPIHPNPHYAPTIATATLLNTELNDDNSMEHIVFIRIFDERFRDLLAQKDEKSMLILLYWYAKLCSRHVWWMRKQAWIEGLAICRYLENTWAASGSQEGQTRLKLLEWPKLKLLAAVDEW